MVKEAKWSVLDTLVSAAVLRFEPLPLFFTPIISAIVIHSGHGPPLVHHQPARTSGDNECKLLEGVNLTSAQFCFRLVFIHSYNTGNLPATLHAATLHASHQEPFPSGYMAEENIVAVIADAKKSSVGSGPGGVFRPHHSPKTMYQFDDPLWLCNIKYVDIAGTEIH